jgi:hypothetical protein
MMETVREPNEKMRYAALFDAYDHSVPVIYSSLNGQYPGTLDLTKEEGKTLALLLTPFRFHFVAGNPHTPNAAEHMHRMLFETYLRETRQKEAVVFCPDASWHALLDEVFRRHRGVKDVRKRFRLNRSRFREAAAAMKETQDVRTILSEEQDCGAKTRYPVCRIVKDGKSVSFCSAFMLGKGRAELDVGTEEGYRGRGYAKRAAVTLIGELLRRNIEPDWCAWPYRTTSQALAKSVGFEALPDVPAYIWTEKDCGPPEG